MKNFNFASRTKIHFGEGSISYLEKELENYGDRILLLYGGGSIKKTGIYDSVIKILKKSNKKVFEVYGVMPNPTYAKVLEGTKACKENNIDLEYKPLYKDETNESFNSTIQLKQDFTRLFISS